LPPANIVPDVFHISINGNVWVDGNRSSVLNHAPILTVGRPDLRAPIPAQANRPIITAGETAATPVSGLNAFLQTDGARPTFSLVPTPTGEHPPGFCVVRIERVESDPTSGAANFRIVPQPSDVGATGPAFSLPLSGAGLLPLGANPNCRM
jgi:hypothetical protein